MYKVFFKDRTVFLSNEAGYSITDSKTHFYKSQGLNNLRNKLESFFKNDEIEALQVIHEDLEMLWNDFKSCFTQINAGGGLVRNPQGELLFIFRRGKWDLPKGKADGKEKIMETALREVREECGIKALEAGQKITDTYHSYYIGEEPVLKKTTWFEMYHDGNENPSPQLEENITRVRWADSADLDFLIENTFPSILDVLAKAGISV